MVKHTCLLDLQDLLIQISWLRTKTLEQSTWLFYLVLSYCFNSILFLLSPQVFLPDGCFFYLLSFYLFYLNNFHCLCFIINAMIVSFFIKHFVLHFIHELCHTTCKLHPPKLAYSWTSLKQFQHYNLPESMIYWRTVELDSFFFS